MKRWRWLPGPWLPVSMCNCSLSLLDTLSSLSDDLPCYSTAMIIGPFSHHCEPDKSLFFIKYSALCVLLQQQKTDKCELQLNSDTLCLIKFCWKYFTSKLHSYSCTLFSKSFAFVFTGVILKSNM